MSNHWSECKQRHLPVKAKLTHSHPLPGPGDPDMSLARPPLPPSLSPAGLWQPRPGRAAPRTAADIYSPVPSQPCPSSEAPEGSAPTAVYLPWLPAATSNRGHQEVQGRVSCKNWHCAALILKLSFPVLWLGAGEAGRNEFLTHFSLGIFGLQCLHLPTAHPQGPITVQPPTPPPLPPPTPLPLPPPTPPPQHQPIPPRQPQAIILHPTAGALRSLPAVPHG